MNKKIFLSCFAALAFSACILPAANAVDGWSVEAGGGNGVNVARAGLQWNWEKRFFTSGDWHVRPYWDLQLGRWNGASGITDLGFTPTFRLEQKHGYGVYLEGAIGFHYLSGKNVAGNKQLSTNFQFGDHVQVGYRFGAKGNYDVGLRLQHHSNGGIKHPNPGVNFALLRFQYHF